MKDRITYAIAALLVGFAVFAVMHWLFYFDTPASVMFGIIAATAEIGANYIIQFIKRSKKDSSV